MKGFLAIWETLCLDFMRASVTQGLYGELWRKLVSTDGEMSTRIFCKAAIDTAFRTPVHRARCSLPLI